MKLDDLAAFLALATVPERNGVDLNYFNGAHVHLPECEEAMEISEGHIHMGVKPTDLRTFDTTLLVRVDDEGRRGNELFALSRYRFVTPKQVRGRVVAVLPQMVECSAALVRDDGTYFATDRCFVGWRGGLGWTHLTTGKIVRPGTPVDEDTLTTLRVAMGVEFNKPFDWLVDLGFGASPALRIPTDATGVREAFALRDIEPGKARRAAIMHWVKAHYRKRRDDAAARTFVQKHLRGADRFVWHDMTCRITQPRKAAA